MSDSAFCAQCGTAIAGTKFCTGCGAAVAQAKPPAPVKPMPPRPTESPNAVTAQVAPSTSAVLSTVSIVFACVSLWFYPYIFGVIALILAIIAVAQKQRASGVALGLSIAFPVIGIIIWIAFFNALLF